MLIFINSYWEKFGWQICLKWPYEEQYFCVPLLKNTLKKTQSSNAMKNLFHACPHGLSTRYLVSRRSPLLYGFSHPSPKDFFPTITRGGGDSKESRLATLGLVQSSTNRFAYTFLSSFLCGSSNEVYCPFVEPMMSHTCHL